MIANKSAWIGSCLFGSLLFSGTSLAQEVYAVKSIAKLQITDGTDLANVVRWWIPSQQRVILDGDGEAVLEGSRDEAQVAIRLPAPRDVTGRLLMPKDYWRAEFESVRFKIPAADFVSTKRPEFLKSKRSAFETIIAQRIPGGAWFRHQVRELTKEIGDGKTLASESNAWRFAQQDESTMDLFTGGRAISENLQLERVLPTAKPEGELVPLDSLKGITVREFNWESLIKNNSPKLDALSEYVPADQHAVFFPSFTAMTQAFDLAEEHGTPLWLATESRSEDSLALQRYQSQLALPLSQIARLLGPTVIASVAITGGDPYFRDGTDFVILFDAKNATAVRTFIEARYAQARADDQDVQATSGELDGVSFSAVRSSDRRVCSYVATIDNVVVVTNSPAQIRRLAQTQQQKTPSLAALPEFKFFRARYPLGDERELSFLMLSDATIRRWCGPRWRIASSRRTRAAAVMNDLHARNADAIVKGTVKSADVLSEFWLPELDHFALTPRGVSSSAYGSVAFQTPISEMEFASVTKEEAALYERWRIGYQSNWSNFFDPIGVRITKSKDRVGADVTVMPLIDNSDYGRFMAVSKGSRIGGGSDVHSESLIHAVLAINRESSELKQNASMLSAFAPQIRVNPLSWLGDSVSLYADKDPFWLEVAREKQPEQFMQKNLHRLPAAFHAEVSSGLKLTAFLAGVRAFIEQSAPGMTVWETKEHAGQPYVRVSAAERGRSRDDDWSKIAIFYLATADSLTVTPNEDLLKRAIDRQVQRRENNPDAVNVRPAEPVWLGENLCLHVSGEFEQALKGMFMDPYQRSMQQAAWSNLPILNEWKRLYPDRDPVAVHEQVFGVRLVCPSGETYRWNEAWRTLESPAFGHPGEPKRGAALPAAYTGLQAADFGVTFEEHGLRTRLELTKPPKP